MSLARFSVNRPVTVLMGMLAVLVLGIMSWRELKIDLLPDISYPVLAVITVYPGAGPEEVEEYVTRRIEEQAGLVKGLKHIRSESYEGVSVVMLEFEWGQDMDYAAFDTREKIDQVLGDLPDEAERPYIVRMDPSSIMPVATASVTGSMDLRQLRKLTEDVIRRELEKVEGVASVGIYGGLEREIQVVLDRGRLSAYGLTVQQVEQALEAENLNVPGGHIELGDREYIVRTYGEFQSPEEIENVAVAVKDGVAVRISDIGYVRDSHKEVRSKSRVNAKPAIVLLVRKESDANAVRVAHRLYEATRELNKHLPGDVKVEVTWTSASYIEQALHNMYGVAEEGAILAVIIIFLFLTSARSTLVIATSIPLSLLATFTLMRLQDMTLNLVTMGGLTLAIGRIVDDSIVVLENIYKHIERGKPAFQAAIDGAGEVGVAILAATLTTVCVFFPIAWVGGLVGHIFSPLVSTVTTALMMSLLVSLTVIPMAAARMLAGHVRHATDGGWWWLRPVDMALQAWQRGYERLEAAYGRAIEWCLGHRGIVVAVAGGLFLVSLGLIGRVGAEFIPETDRTEIMIQVRMPVGTNVEATDRVARYMENEILKLPEVELVETTVGEVSFGAWVSSVREASLILKLKPSHQRTRTSQQIAQALREKFRDIPGAEISFITGFESAMGGEAPINITIYGEDLDELWRIGREAIERFKREIPEMTDLRLNWQRGAPEYRIVLDREKAGTYGLTTWHIAAAIRSLVKGEDVTKFREKGKEYDITVRLPAGQRADVNQLKDIMIKTPSGALVPLVQVARIEETVGPTMISRYEHRRSIEVLADKKPGVPLDRVIKKADQVLSQIQMPAGYSYEFRGSEKRRRESFQGMAVALALGIVLIYIILASQFESVVQPFIIMLAIPLEVIGAFGALALTGTPLSIMSYLGLLLLTGIVVSNSILLVHVVNLLRHRGMDTNQALVEGGKLRLRPILMTAIATFVSMIPMALALREGSDLWRPLGITVLGGLFSSTALTLLVVPVAYSLVDQVARKLGIAGLGGRVSEAELGSIE